MIALVRSELLKLRTPAQHRLGGGSRCWRIALLTAGLAIGDAGEKDFSTPQELRDTILAIGYAAVFFLAVIGADRGGRRVLATARSPSASSSAPARHRVLMAKLATYALVGIGTALVVTAISAALGEAVVSSKGYTLDLADAGLRMTAGIVRRDRVRGACSASSSAPSPATRRPRWSTIFGVWIAGKIVGDWIGDAAQYLPFSLIENVLGLDQGIAWGYAALALVGMTAALGARRAARVRAARRHLGA